MEPQEYPMVNKAQKPNCHSRLVSESNKLPHKLVHLQKFNINYMEDKTFAQIIKLSLEIKKIYGELYKNDGHKKWEASDYTMGMVGDCGDLSKLIMAKNKLRKSKSSNIDESIEHELVDILWSLVAISDELNIDLEAVSFVQLKKLKSRLEKTNLDFEKQIMN
jgi:NTP pyrophosphatase (non-canonical NTP hydrolase)